MTAYVAVSTDLADKVIKAGPVLWDGVAPYDPGLGRQLVLAADASAQGYTFPAPPAGQVNTATLRSRAAQALDANATFLALASPTQAQTLTQVKALTRECTLLIRLLLDLTDTTDGT